MTLVARDGIESFPPTLHRNVVYVRNAEQLKPFILSKLINAEYAAYRCRTFSLLQERTRCSYLKTLCENLTEKSYEALCDEVKRTSHRRLSIISNSTKKRYLTNVKKIFTRSNSTPDGTQHQPVKNEFLTQEKVRYSCSTKAEHRVFSIYLTIRNAGSTKIETEIFPTRKFDRFERKSTLLCCTFITRVKNYECSNENLLIIHFLLFFSFIVMNWAVTTF